MAIGLTIPFSSRMPGSNVRPPDDDLTSRVKAQGAQQIGKSVVHISDTVYEWQRRRDVSALEDATAQLEVWANQTVGDLQNRSDDELSEVDPETQEIGFKKAGKSFSQQWKKQAGDLGSRLSRMDRDQFSRFSMETYEKWRNRLASGMLTREVEANQNRVRSRISELAVSDREALYKWAPGQIEKWFPEKERPRQTDYVMEQDIRHLIRVNPDLAVKELEALGEQAWNYEDTYDRLMYYAKQKTKTNETDSESMSLAARRDARLKAVDLIDKADPEFDSFMETVGNQLLLDKPVSSRDLLEWRANRNRDDKTNVAVKLDLLGKVLSTHDDHDFRMKLAKARYGGKKGELSTEDYDALKAIQDKRYAAHESGVLKAGYDAIRSSTTTVSGFGGFGGWAGNVPHSYEEQDEATKQLISWFDSRREQNNIPDPIETVTYAKKLMAVTKTNPKETEIPKEEIAAKFGKIPKIETDSDYDKLPSGTMFLDPNGKLRKKP